MAESRSRNRGYRRHAPRLLQLLLGLLGGLAVAEGVFWARDHGAFPHLNVYVADAAYGARLRPGASTRIAFGGSAVTSVAIHSGGFRGATPGAEPAAQEGEVLFVGDSQTFGLGVEAEQAFAARFAELSRLPVYNAGVPTWGPPEFARAMQELGQRRHPSTIVYVVNFANDAFEAERPNTQRHAVWDGWAVRRETAPASVAGFPGRALLFQRSHLVFALRQWWYRHGAGPAQNAERGTPSEGTFRDLFKLGQTFSAEQLAAREETERRAQLYESESVYADESYRRAEAHVRALVWDKMKLGGGDAGYNPNAAGTVYLAADANPGDIVVPGLGEEGRPAYATAVYIRQAVELRNKFEAQLRALAQAALDSDEGKQILAALSERDRERVKRAAVRRKPLELVRATSPLTQAVLKAKAQADALRARFVLLALPIDVMVSDTEWPKHGKARIDLAPARVLIQDLVESVQAAGGVALDATKALAAAEPGAFLPGDIHLTPKGHVAVARALFAALKSPEPPPPTPQLTLAEGRSRVPPPETWQMLGGQVAVNGSSRCPVTKKYREWLYVRCYSDNPKAPQGVGLQVAEGGLGDAITWVKDGKMTLVAPIPKGSGLEALFTWSDGKTQRLRVEWDAAGSAPGMSMAFEDGVAASAPDAKTAERVCACYQSAHAGADCGSLIANADSTCVETYANDCPRLLACAQGDALAPPRCPAGSRNAGASLHCLKEASATAAAPATPELLTAAPPAATTELEAAAAALLKSAIAFVGPKCRLGQDDVELLYGIPFDRCPIDAGMVADYQKAWTEFDALASRTLPRGAAATFRAKAGAFGQFTTTALQSTDTRGTAALYQDLALSYNRWQPSKAVAVDPPRILDLYFGVAHLPSNDYLRNLRHDGDQRRAKFEASGKHFVWQRGPNGFEGPYMDDDLRATSGFSDSR